MRVGQQFVYVYISMFPRVTATLRSSGLKKDSPLQLPGNSLAMWTWEKEKPVDDVVAITKEMGPFGGLPGSHELAGHVHTR